jgi:hypothetical protein
MKICFGPVRWRKARLAFGFLFSVIATLQMQHPGFALGLGAGRQAPAADVQRQPNDPPAQSDGNAAAGAHAKPHFTDDRFGGSEPANKGAASSVNTSLPEQTLVKPRIRRSREACRNQRRAVDRFDPKQFPADDSCADIPSR